MTLLKSIGFHNLKAHIHLDYKGGSRKQWEGPSCHFVGVEHFLGLVKVHDNLTAFVWSGLFLCQNWEMKKWLPQTLFSFDFKWQKNSGKWSFDEKTLLTQAKITCNMSVNVDFSSAVRSSSPHRVEKLTQPPVACFCRPPFHCWNQHPVTVEPGNDGSLSPLHNMIKDATNVNQENDAITSQTCPSAPVFDDTIGN